MYFSVKINSLSLFFYNLFLVGYTFGIQLASLWNGKAKKWVLGRRRLMYNVRSTMEKINHSPIIWMHCASVGEFEQGRTIIEKLKAENKNLTIVLTFFSPSGYEACKNYKEADAIFYLPMDGKKNAQQFLDALQPTVVLWIKYEFWYYYLQALKNRKIPTILVSGTFRDNQPFFKWYGSFWQQMLHCFSFLFLQNEEGKELLSSIQLNNKLVVNGDTRFDRVCAIADNFTSLPLIEKFCGDSKVFIAGSTWGEDEEELIHYVKTHPQIKFIIVPHELEEIKRNAETFQQISVKNKPQLIFEEDTETIQPTFIETKKEINEQITSTPSVNDKLKQAKIDLGDTLTEVPIRELKKAIGINDRFLFINELFRGDEAMYERSIKTINGFSILAEAEYWIQRELKTKIGWNDKLEVVQQFNQLIKRRFS